MQSSEYENILFNRRKKTKTFSAHCFWECISGVTHRSGSACIPACHCCLFLSSGVFKYSRSTSGRPQSWFQARPSVHFSTSTAPWWLSASVPLRGAGEGGFKRWSSLSSNPDPKLLIASRINPSALFSLCIMPFPLQCLYTSSRRTFFT